MPSINKKSTVVLSEVKKGKLNEVQGKQSIMVQHFHIFQYFKGQHQKKTYF